MGVTFTAKQVAAMVRQAGMPSVRDNEIPNLENDAWWVATILAESSGNTDPPGNATHTGWLQMSDQHAGRHPSGSPSNVSEYRRYMKNPIHNLKGGKSLFSAQGQAAWNASESGRRRHAATARAAVSDPDVSGAIEKLQQAGISPTGDSDDVPNIPGVTSEIDLVPDSVEEAIALVADTIAGVASAVVEFANRIGGWISKRENWLRATQVVGGVGLGIVAVSVIAKPVVDDATKAVSQVPGPVGKVAKAIK